MWLQNDLYYVVCPRTARFMDYFPAMLREDLAREILRLGPDGQTPRKAPLIEVKILGCRSIGSVSDLLGPAAETIASVTLKDPASGLVVGTAICIGLTASSVVEDRSRTNMLAPAPRTPLRRPARGVARAAVSSSPAGKRAVWAGGARFNQGCSDRLPGTAAAPREGSGYAGTTAVSVLTARWNRTGSP